MNWYFGFSEDGYSGWLHVSHTTGVVGIAVGFRSYLDFWFSIRPVAGGLEAQPIFFYFFLLSVFFLCDMLKFVCVLLPLENSLDFILVW